MPVTHPEWGQGGIEMQRRAQRGAVTRARNRIDELEADRRELVELQMQQTEDMRYINEELSKARGALEVAKIKLRNLGVPDADGEGDKQDATG